MNAKYTFLNQTTNNLQMNEVDKALEIRRKELQKKEDDIKQQEIRKKLAAEERDRKEKLDQLERSALYDKKIAEVEEKIRPDDFFNDVYNSLCTDETKQIGVLNLITRNGLPVPLFKENGFSQGGYYGYDLFEFPSKGLDSSQTDYAIRMSFAVVRSKIVRGGKLDGLILRSKKHSFSGFFCNHLLTLEKPSFWNMWGFFSQK